MHRQQGKSGLKKDRQKSQPPCERNQKESCKTYKKEREYRI